MTMKAAQQPTGRWVPCDSRSALIAQKSKNACEQLITESPNSWGYMAFESGTIIPIGYADMGLLPVAVMHGNKIFVGVDELIAAYNWPSNTRHFKYKMPTVFHEFVRFDRDELIVRDEIGFVGISYDGDEHWKFCVDTIASYEIKEMIIFGETEEGQVFKFTIPSTKSPPPAT